MFSVVMAAYNAEKFIAEAIESVLAQTFMNLNSSSSTTAPRTVPLPLPRRMLRGTLACGLFRTRRTAGSRLPATRGYSQRSTPG